MNKQLQRSFAALRKTAKELKMTAKELRTTANEQTQLMGLPVVALRALFAGRSHGLADIALVRLRGL